MTRSNSAPERCASCVHVAIQSVMFDGRVTPRDRCAHPAGPKPMFNGCGWHKEKARINGVATPPRA